MRPGQSEGPLVVTSTTVGGIGAIIACNLRKSFGLPATLDSPEIRASLSMRGYAKLQVRAVHATCRQEYAMRALVNSGRRSKSDLIPDEVLFIRYLVDFGK